MAQRIEFNNGAVLAISDSGEKGQYSDGDRSIPVRVIGFSEDGAVKFARADGREFRQRGIRALELNSVTEPFVPNAPSPSDRHLTLKNRSAGRGMPPSAQPAVGYRNNNMNRLIRPMVGNQYKVGPGAGRVYFPEALPAVQFSATIPWMVRGSSTMPTGTAESSAMTLFTTTVPRGYVLRLTGFAAGIGRSDSELFWEDTLLWRLKVGNIDLFNQFNERQPANRLQYFNSLGIDGNNLWTGRPVRDESLVPFSMIAPDLMIIQPGTTISCTVQLVNAWIADVPQNTIWATLTGSLWGEKS